MEKLTRKATFTKAMEYFKANGLNAEADVMAKAIASLEKKSENKKPTATQVENESLKERILDYLLTVEKATIKEISLNVEGLANATPQKISSLLVQLMDKFDKETGELVKAGSVKRTLIKKVAYFSAA